MTLTRQNKHLARFPDFTGEDADKARQEARKLGPTFREWDVTEFPNKEILEKSVELFFLGIGEDPTRSDLIDTPARVAKVWMETLNGYNQDPKDFITQFENANNYNGPVILQGAELYSTCGHHLQPFLGEVDIAYQPKDKIVGLSKLLRVARVYAKRLQVQEHLTKEIADALYELLDPEWVVVRYRAEHYCMRLRGVRIKGSYTTTIYGHGNYPKDIFNQ